MKIKYIGIAAVIIFLCLGAAVIASLWNTQLICMSDGQCIEATKAWVILDEIFYEKGEGTLFTVDTDGVEEILSANFSSFHDWRVILSHAAASDQGIFAFLGVWELWALFFAVLAVYPAYLGLHALMAMRGAAGETDEDSQDLISVPLPPQASDTERVVIFFLTIFLLQIRARRKDRYDYQPLELKGPLNTSVYEFRAHVDGRWQVRRISLGRIGEDSGARSKCFYVIYDDHFVVKIPPEPVTDIQEYIQIIRADHHISDLLSPRECLVPGVSIILNRIPGFLEAVGESPAEPACMDGLVRYPEFQRFLKIGPGFALFMNLSRHFFLGQILKECHDAGPEIAKEIHRHRDLIWSPTAFAERYGEEHTELCLKLKKIYDDFDRGCTDSDIPASRKKRWFAGVLLEDKTPLADDVIPERPLHLLRDLMREHGQTVRAYRRIIEDYTRDILLKRNVAKVRNICSQLIDLSAWLFLKRISIRDLKPDNLFVAGDPSKYPQFLSIPDGFSLGLIDVETAVYLNPHRKYPDQPKIGWTPLYATPAHLFINEVLGALYEDVCYIYFMQDWYATVAMVFQAATGEKLFERTAGELTRLAREMARYFGDFQQMCGFAKTANRKFWVQAADEFDGRMGQLRGVLAAISIEITRDAKKMFSAAAEKSRDPALKKRLEQAASGISAFELLRILFDHVRESMAVRP